MGTDVSDQTSRIKQLISERRYQEAVRMCRRMLLARPDEVEVRLLLGTALLAMRRYEEVRVEMLALTRRVPNQARAHRLLGEAYLRSSQTTKAVESLQRAKQLDPGDAVTQELLAEVEDDTAPHSETIERWFSPEAAAALQGEPAPAEGAHAGREPHGGEDRGAPGAARGAAGPMDAVPTRAAPRRPQPPSPPPAQRSEWHDPAASLHRMTGSDEHTSPLHPKNEGPSGSPFVSDPAGYDDDEYTVDESSVVDALEPGAPAYPPARGTAELGAADGYTLERPWPASPARPEPPGPSSRPPPPAPQPPPLYGEGVDPDAMETQHRPPPDEPPSAEQLHSQDLLPSLPDPADLGPGALPPQQPWGHSGPMAAEPSPFGGPQDDADGPTSAYEPIEDEPTTARAPAELEDELEERPTVARPEGAAPGALGYDPGAGASRGREPSGPSPGAHAGGGLPSPDAFFMSPGQQDGRGLGFEYPSPENAPPTVPDEPPAPARAAGAPGAQHPWAPPSAPQSAAAPGPHAAVPQTDAGEPSRPAALPRGKRRLSKPALLAATGVPLVLVAGGIVGLLLWLDQRAEQQVYAAVRTATGDGLSTSLEEALQVARDKGSDAPESVALRARLLAMAELEHGHGERAEAQQLLAGLDGGNSDLPDARVARAYLALASGEVERAREIVGDVRAEGEVGVEASRVRALTAAAHGDLERAVEHARTAVSSRPSAPRHVALYALLTALNGDAAAGLSALDGLEQGEHSPAVRMARARILQESGRDPVRAVQEAEVVVEQLASVATRHQQGWAHLIRARHAASAGNAEQALSEADRAAELGPRGDEQFGLSLVETFLQADAPDQAYEQLDALPDGSAQPARRALLEAEVALARGDTDAAHEALDKAEDGPRVAYLRGRVQEARGNLDEARELYEQAASDPRELVRARTRLGALALRQGDSERAVEMLEAARERAPADRELVPLLVRALLEQGELSRANEVVRVATARRDGSVPLLIAKARVDLARGAVSKALKSLRSLAEKRSDDVEVHAMLGQAARRAGEHDEAEAAFDRALELDDTHGEALLGKARLALVQEDVEAARDAIERAEEGGLQGPALNRVRGRLLVLEGMGVKAVEVLADVPAAGRDAALWSALGWAHAQAEQDGPARKAFSRALKLEGDDVDAHLGMALVYTRMGALSRASRHIGSAERAARSQDRGDQAQSRVLTARAEVRFEYGDMGEAKKTIEEAIEKDESNAAAHLLLARIVIQQDEDPIPHLRKALEGRRTPPEAIGRLVARLDPGEDEVCELAERYLEAAPQGYDAPDVKDQHRRCK